MNPQSIPWLQTSGKRKAHCKQQGCNQSLGIMLSSRLHHSPTSALLPRWRSLIYLCISSQRSGINYKPHGAALNYAQLPAAASSQMDHPRLKAEGGAWGGERWGPDSTCSPALPGCWDGQRGVNPLICSLFEITICPCPKGTASCKSINVCRN